MKRLACLLLVLSVASPAFAAREREAPTITPRFTATPVQGPACAPPCIVHLDASATTADGYAVPFNDLTFEWTCDKERAEWPINACRFDTPGDHAIVLRVTRPDTGETAFAAQTVHVAEPGAVARVELEPGKVYASTTLPQTPARALVVTTKPGGPPARIAGNVTLRDGWTLAGVDVDGTVSAPCGVRGTSLVDVNVRAKGREDLYVTPYGCATHNDLAAIWGGSLVGDQGRVFFVRVERFVARYVLWDGGSPAMKNGVNCATQGCPNAYTARTTHFPHSAVVDSVLKGAGPRDNVFNLRSWGQSAPPPLGDNEYVVIAGNTMEATATGEGWIRICDGSTCADDNITFSVDVRRVRVERNRFVLLPGGTYGMAIRFEGGEHAFRENVVELPPDAKLPASLRFAVQDADSTKPKGTPGPRTNGGTEVCGNRIEGAKGRPVQWLAAIAASKGNVIEGNVAP